MKQLAKASKGSNLGGTATHQLPRVDSIPPTARIKDGVQKRGLAPPNYTQIPNVLIDKWMSRLTPSELRIILYIARRTFGFHRKSVEIGMRLLAERAGLHLETVSTAIAALVAVGLVRSKTGVRRRQIYELVIDAELPDCAERPDITCTENPNTDCSEKPNTKKERSSSKKKNTERNVPEKPGVGAHAEATPESKAKSQKPTSKADDDEKLKPEPKLDQRKPLDDPRQEFAARLQERHGGIPLLDPKRILRVVGKELGNKGCEIDAEFLAFDEAITKAPSAVTNPGGYYTDVARQFGNHKRSAALTDAFEASRNVIGPPVEGPPICVSCKNAIPGRGGILSPDASQGRERFEFCPCSSPAYRQDNEGFLSQMNIATPPPVVEPPGRSG